MATTGPANRLLSIILVCVMCLSGIPPFMDSMNEASASRSKIPGLDSENIFYPVWSNKTDSNSTLREEPRDIFTTTNVKDLDKDGLSEIVVGDASGWFYVYEYNGTDNNYTEKYSNDTGGSVIHTVTCGDLDGDGDMEIVTGGDNNQIRIYEWNQSIGSDNYTLANLSNLGGEVRDMEIRDLDNDFKNELVVGWDQGVTIYSFNQTYHFATEFHYGTGHPIYSISTGDYNSNMKTDVAAGELNHSSIYIFENIAWDVYTQVLFQPLQMNPGNASGNVLCLETVDIDSDGKEELISGSGSGELNLITTPNIYANITFSQLDKLGNGEIWDIFFEDADLDKRNDIYVAADHNYSVYDYEYVSGDKALLKNYDKMLLSGPLGSNAEPAPSSIFIADPDNDGRGDVIVGCFGDANDSMLFVLERNVFNDDVEVSGINFPTDGGTLPTGSYNINATVRNLGTKQEVFDVNCSIYDSNLNLIYASNEIALQLSSGESAYIDFDFPPWIANTQGTYHINVTTQLPADENRSNDYRNITINITDIYDLSVESVILSGLAPYGEGENISINASILNVGNMQANTVPVYLMINSTQGYYYNDTDQTINLGPGNSTDIAFTPAWAPPTEGIYTVNISIMWDLDHNITNNYSYQLLPVKNIIDISAEINKLVSGYSIIDPRDGLDIFNTNTSLVVNGTVKNLGNKEETFNVTLNITDDNDTSVFLKNRELTLGKGELANVEFDKWNTQNISYANYTINISASEPDENQGTDNNYSTKQIRVWDMYDLGASDIKLNRSVPLNTNISINVNATIKNTGNLNLSNYTVRLEIRNSTGVLDQSESTLVETRLNRSETYTASYQLNTPLTEGFFTINVTVIYENDTYGPNNFTTLTINVDDLHDIAMDTLTFQGLNVQGHYPTGVHSLGATTRNLGTTKESFDVRIKVGHSSGNNLTLLNDDMENGSGSWEHISLEGDDLWHMVNSSNSFPGNHSNDTSWWFGSEQTGHYNNSTRAIIYQTIDLGNAFHASVDFWMNHSFENGDDYSRLVINNDTTLDPRNATWTEIDGPYTGNSTGWLWKDINISSYAGQKIQIGFSIYSDADNADFRGIYLDDVRVNITQTAFDHLNTVNKDLEPNASALIADAYNFAQEADYLIIFESTLPRDEVDGNNITTWKLNILNYHDIGTTETVLISKRNEEVRYSASFEDPNAPQWTHGGVNDDWAKGSPVSGPMMGHSPENVWATNLQGKYLPNASSWLMTPSLIRIPWGSSVEFWIWYSTNLSMNDVLSFQVSNNSGTTWTTMREYTGSTLAWQKEQVSLGDFYGNLSCRFFFSSDGQVQGDGFYIDDFRAISTAPFHVGETSSFNVTIHNFGNVPETNPELLMSVTNTENQSYKFSEKKTTVVTLQPGDSHTFVWNYLPPENGTYSVFFDTILSTDLDMNNNRSFGSVVVYNHTDIQVLEISKPTDDNVFRLGETFEITASISNEGTWDWQSVPVSFNITTNVNGRDIVKNHTVYKITLSRNETSNVSHKFTIPYMQGARYDIRVSVPLNNTQDMNFVNNDKTIFVYGLSVEKSPALFGYVTSKFDGEPIKGASVSRKIGDDTRLTVTDVKGFYWFQLDNFGSVEIRVVSEGFITLTTTVTADQNKNLRKDLALEVANYAPTVSIVDTPEFAIVGETVTFDVAFGDLDIGQDHFFNISSNISGNIDVGGGMNLGTSSFSFNSSQLETGVHRIFVNVSDLYSKSSTSAVLVIYGLRSIDESAGFPLSVWLEGEFGGSGDVLLQYNDTKPDHCANISNDLAVVGGFATVNMTGQGRIKWTRILFKYSESSLPPGSYQEDLGLYYYDDNNEKWIKLNASVIDTGNNSIFVNQSNTPSYGIYTLLVKRDLTEPTITGVEPQDGAGDVDVATNYTIGFSELIDHTTIEGSITVLDSGNNEIEFDIKVVDDTRNQTTNVTLDFTESLDYLRGYTVNISSNLSDLAGNILEAISFKFITIKAPVSTGTLLVEVRNENNGPIKNALIGIDAIFYISSTGDLNKKLKPGIHTVEVKGKLYSGIRYEGYLGEVEVKLNETITHRITLQEWVEPPPPVPWGVLVGNVTDENGLPLSGTELIIKWLNKTIQNIPVGNDTNNSNNVNNTNNTNNTNNNNNTNETVKTVESIEFVSEYFTTIITPNGSFYIILVPGNYTITFESIGYQAQTVEINISGGDERTWLNVTLIKKIEYGYLVFTVVDSKGEALTGMLVELQGEVNDTVFELYEDEGEPGKYRSINLPEGIYLLKVWADRYEEYNARVGITTGEDGKMNDIGNIEMWKNIEIHPPPINNEADPFMLIGIIILAVLVLLIVVLILVKRSKEKQMLMDKDKRPILWLDEISLEDVALIGNKAAYLGELTSKTGVPVPVGFTTTRAAFEMFMSGEVLSEKLNEKIAKFEDPEDVELLGTIGKQCRYAILKTDLSPAFEKAVGLFYDELVVKYREMQGKTAEEAEDEAEEEPYLAVRLSVDEEKLPHELFAAGQKSYLNIRGLESVLERIKECYSLTFTDEAILHRRLEEIDHTTEGISIIVQLMVFSKGAGTMCTLDASGGNRDLMSIKAAYGLGEYVVEEKVTPHSYLVNKDSVEIEERKITPLGIMLTRSSEGGVEEVPVSPDDFEKELLSDEQVAELATLGKEMETHFEKHMEMEWALDERDGMLWMINARPEVYWSSKPQETEEQVEFTCPDCGETVEEKETFCDSCGADFEAPERTVVEKVVERREEEFLCPECGKTVAEEAKKCDSCDADFETPITRKTEEITEDEMVEEEPLEPETITEEDIEDIDLGDLEEETGEDISFDIDDLDDLDDDVSLSALDMMVSRMLGEEEGEPETPEEEPPDEPDEQPVPADETEAPEEEDMMTLDDLDLDEIEIEGDDDMDLDIDLDDISIEDLEMSLDELGE
ncbi:MAG: PEP/pyruvate-binding domain-containing protein [Candidatus Thermoplasmatota archaeon]|nr:PEP/pyruvate-binding domain-containing protein [Candidatus Thermoplasmatota archaeon]